MHAVDSTFGGLIRSEDKDKYCHLRVNLDITNPLQRGIFVSIDERDKLWIAFKYENLLGFCFHCGIMGHGFKDCLEHSHMNEGIVKEDFPFSSTLKADSLLMGKEWYKFGGAFNKYRSQCSYVGNYAALENTEVLKNSSLETTLMVKDMEGNRNKTVNTEPVLEKKISESDCGNLLDSVINSDLNIKDNEADFLGDDMDRDNGCPLQINDFSVDVMELKDHSHIQGKNPRREHYVG